MTFLFSGHTLDGRTRELRRGPVLVHLEPQVFDLLAFLIENRDRIVSKDEILDAVWDGRIVSEAALSSRIASARKAIGDTGEGQALIRTFHKRGFRFVGTVETQDDGPDESGPALAAAAIADGESAAATALAPAADGAGTDPVRAQNRPSIAVLPFVNVAGDPEQDYFCYGLTEDVVRLLGRNRWLTVLSRHSAAFRGEMPNPVQIAGLLGVRYLVAGSVRRSGEQVRISVELLVGEDGRQLWSEVYDLSLADIFEIQEAIAQQIAATIEPELGDVERNAAARKIPDSLDAWDCYQRGFWHLWGFTNPGFREAAALFQRAIEIDPGLARAHAALSYVHLQQSFYDVREERAEHLRVALAEAQIAVALDERDCLCHCVLGRAHFLSRNYQASIEALRLTIELNPSFAQGYFALGISYAFSGEEEEAIALIERAAELSPRDPHLWTFYHIRALAHLRLDEPKSAEFFARKARQHPTATHFPFISFAVSLVALGRMEEARAAVADILVKRPGYNLASARDDFFFCGDDDDFVDRYIAALRQAGLPEGATSRAKPRRLAAPMQAI